MPRQRPERRRQLSVARRHHGANGTRIAPRSDHRRTAGHAAEQRFEPARPRGAGRVSRKPDAGGRARPRRGPGCTPPTGGPVVASGGAPGGRAVPPGRAGGMVGPGLSRRSQSAGSADVHRLRDERQHREAAVLDAHRLRSQHRDDQVAGAGRWRRSRAPSPQARRTPATSASEPASSRRQRACCSRPAAMASCASMIPRPAACSGRVRLPAGSRGIPAMYEVNGRQFFVVNATSTIGGRTDDGTGRSGRRREHTSRLRCQRKELPTVTRAKSPRRERRVLRDEIRDQLIEEILNGRLAPGERIVEMRIAQQFGVSQAPVREALRDLDLLGFVVSSPFRGAIVRQISVEELRAALSDPGRPRRPRGASCGDADRSGDAEEARRSSRDDAHGRGARAITAAPSKPTSRSTSRSSRRRATGCFSRSGIACGWRRRRS